MKPTSRESTGLTGGSTPNAWRDRAAAALSAENDLASATSQSITTTETVVSAGCYAFSVTRPSGSSSSTKQQPNEPVDTSKTSRSTCDRPLPPLEQWKRYEGVEK